MINPCLTGEIRLETRLLKGLKKRAWFALDYVIRLSNNPKTREVYSLMIIIDKWNEREDIK